MRWPSVAPGRCCPQTSARRTDHRHRADAKARATGRRTRGTVRCEVPGRVRISGTVTQGKSTGNFDDINVDCSDTVATWTASVASTLSRAFSNGAATVTAEAEASDPNYVDADGTPLIAKSQQAGSVELDR